MKKFIRRTLMWVCSVHRATFVAATIALSVAASRLANDYREYGSALVTAGAGIILAVADFGGDLEREATELAKASKSSVSKARADLYAVKPQWPTASLGIGVVLVIAGFGYGWVTAR